MTSILIRCIRSGCGPRSPLREACGKPLAAARKADGTVPFGPALAFSAGARHAALGFVGRDFHALKAVMALCAPSMVRKRRMSTFGAFFIRPVRAPPSQTTALRISRQYSRIGSGCTTVATPESRGRRAPCLD